MLLQQLIATNQKKEKAEIVSDEKTETEVIATEKIEETMSNPNLASQLNEKKNVF